MLKLKLQYCGHLRQTADSLEKSLMLGEIEGRRRRGHQRMKWLDGITDAMDMMECGIFGADMKVSLLNDGPVTIVLDTDILKK